MPRHIFVDEALGSRAYEDVALPIGYGQTISQPYIVARMTEALLEGGPADSALEVGTGCGSSTNRVQMLLRIASARVRLPSAATILAAIIAYMVLTRFLQHFTAPPREHGG